LKPAGLDTSRVGAGLCAESGFRLSGNVDVVPVAGAPAP
jgi:hypothetical protein